MKIKKYFMGYAGACILFFYLAGCAHDPMQPALVNYVNQDILRISALEQRSLAAYAGVTGANYTTPGRVGDAIENTVIPVYREFLVLLKQINPQVPAIRQIHAVYVRGGDTLFAGFNEKKTGIALNDNRLIRMANEKIRQGRTLTNKWREQLAALVIKHKIGSQKH